MRVNNQLLRATYYLRVQREAALKAAAGVEGAMTGMAPAAAAAAPGLVLDETDDQIRARCIVGARCSVFPGARRGSVVYVGEVLPL